MSAEILQEAAALMRSRADIHTSPPWEAWVSGDRKWTLVGDPLDVENGVAARCADDDEADYIASWHPAVALAVADWLEWMADNGRVNMKPEWYLHGWDHAVAVARAYLGGGAE